MKICKCGESNIAMFYGKRRAELQTYCKACLKIRGQVSRMERFAVDPRQRMLEKARKRCYESGREFKLKVSDFTVPTFCPLLGVRLTRGGDLGNYPSLDRVDPAKGYIPGNVMVISHRANTIKSNATVEELNMLVSNLNRLLEKRGPP